MTLSILVIDDDDMVRGTLVENLRDEGFAVSAADNGVVAMAMLDDGPLPDIVITDIIMPQKEGLETILELRRKYPQVKLIAISGGGRTRGGDFLDMASKLGADAVMAKPLDLEKLGETVRDIHARRAAG